MKKPTKPLESWLTPAEWSLKWPRLEASTYLTVFTVIALAIVVAVYFIYAP